MGKCLSTCFGSPCAQENGQPSRKLSSNKPPSFTPIHTIATTNEHSNAVTTNTSQVTPTIEDSLTSSKSINSDKKMFGNVGSYLPPIRKTANGSEGRRSFSSKEPSDSKINALFEQYKDSDEDAILADGIEQFCEDLNVRPEEFRVLVLAWKFDAENMCKFTRTEFLVGCKSMKVDSIKGIQSKFSDMLKEVSKPDQFKEFYKWTYRFGLDSDLGQRTLSTDIAISLWKLVFTQREPRILDRWLSFLEEHPSIKGIPKDTWDMFLHFVDNVGDDLGLYDDAEAWPSLLDDFVEFENDRQNQNVSEKTTEEYW